MEGDDPFASAGGDNLDFLASADAGGEDPFAGGGGDDLLSSLTSADAGAGAGAGSGGDDPFADALVEGSGSEEPVVREESKQAVSEAVPSALRFACSLPSGFSFC